MLLSFFFASQYLRIVPSFSDDDDDDNNVILPIASCKDDKSDIMRIS